MQKSPVDWTLTPSPRTPAFAANGFFATNCLAFIGVSMNFVLLMKSFPVIRVVLISASAAIFLGLGAMLVGDSRESPEYNASAASRGDTSQSLAIGKNRENATIAQSAQEVSRAVLSNTETSSGRAVSEMPRLERCRRKRPSLRQRPSWPLLIRLPSRKTSRLITSAPHRLSLRPKMLGSGPGTTGRLPRRGRRWPTAIWPPRKSKSKSSRRTSRPTPTTGRPIACTCCTTTWRNSGRPSAATWRTSGRATSWS